MSEAVRVHIDDNGQLMIRCPGCGHVHALDERWTFNGDLVKPTFSPSLNCWRPAVPDDRIPPYRCHAFIRDGMIEFLGDCTHALRGQTVPLPPWTETSA